MKLNLYLLVGVLTASVTVCQAGIATERQSGIVVAQQTQAGSGKNVDEKDDKDKQDKNRQLKKKQQRDQQHPANIGPKTQDTSKPQHKLKTQDNEKHRLPAVKQTTPANQGQPIKTERKTLDKDKDGAPTVQQQELIAPQKTDRPVAIEPHDRKKPVTTLPDGKQPTVQQKIQPLDNKPNKQQLPTVQNKQFQGNSQSDARSRHRKLDDVRSERKEIREGNRTIIRETNRTIIRENGHAIVRHDDSDRFRRGAREVLVEHRGNETVTIVVRPDGSRIITVVDANGRLLRRSRLDSSGHEVILLDNRHRAARHDFDFILNLPAPIVRIPRDRYIVDAERADRALIYETLIAPPIMHIERPYTLDQILYTHALRERMRRIDLDTITFDTGSWEVPRNQWPLLEPLAEAMRRTIRRNPDEGYLIEGHTDSVGSNDDNLSLSDRRAETVAEILTEVFGIPPENLTTQGYGEQYLKIPIQGPERRNRRVTVRRITPLLMGRN